MAQEKQKAKEKQKSSKEWIGWALVALFIVGSIVGMLVFDAVYSPGLYNPATLPDAVGK
jgi:hypothetical protein